MSSVFLFCSIVPGIFGNQQKQHLDSIKQMLHSCLIDQSNAQVCGLAAEYITVVSAGNVVTLITGQ